MIKKLIKIANVLDQKGFYNEANLLDQIMSEAVTQISGLPIALVKKINTYLPSDHTKFPARPENSLAMGTMEYDPINANDARARVNWSIGNTWEEKRFVEKIKGPAQMLGFETFEGDNIQNYFGNISLDYGYDNDAGETNWTIQDYHIFSISDNDPIKVFDAMRKYLDKQIDRDVSRLSKQFKKEEKQQVVQFPVNQEKPVEAPLQQEDAQVIQFPFQNE